MRNAISRTARIKASTAPYLARHLTRSASLNMPLVVPGINDNDHRNNGDKTWQDRLIGKKLGDVTDTTTWARTELPKNSRVLEHDSMYSQDFQPERVNIHLDKDGIISQVRKG